MRCPILPGDVSAVARALLLVGADSRRGLCRQIFAGAALAFQHVEDHRRLHPVWGDGTLNAAARRFPLAPEPGFEDRDYAAATQMVLAVLMDGNLRSDCGPRTAST
ncbi:hypothetical protein GFB49_00680 [Epibacterium sp. SM1979]|uniref:DUF7742 domain-containing protein n=1 Tax=Tritonibacter litoralis TaxID=2662264 RepID=A0A843Y732_9RHOB|nr:hypothetical protein [Tritonibacter litoralis]MQQ06960.1 hypothetical protein [Tritonibacter litoralis]